MRSHCGADVKLRRSRDEQTACQRGKVVTSQDLSPLN